MQEFYNDIYELNLWDWFKEYNINKYCKNNILLKLKILENKYNILYGIMFRHIEYIAKKKNDKYIEFIKNETIKQKCDKHGKDAY